MKVLIIDDDDELRELLKEQFELRGFTVFQAENGKVGLEILTTKAVDLILTDVQMPIMSGMEFLKLAKGLGMPLPPIIVMTAGSPYPIEQFYTEGASAYFDKVSLSIDKVIDVSQKAA